MQLEAVTNEVYKFTKLRFLIFIADFFLYLSCTNKRKVFWRRQQITVVLWWIYVAY